MPPAQVKTLQQSPELLQCDQRGRQPPSVQVPLGQVSAPQQSPEVRQFWPLSAQATVPLPGVAPVLDESKNESWHPARSRADAIAIRRRAPFMVCCSIERQGRSFKDL